MNKKETIERYGKERVKEMHHFLDKINRFYGFVYSDQNLYDFVESLKKFTNEDLERALEILEDRESTFQIKFNEIKLACKDAKKQRERKEYFSSQEIDTSKSCPMPAHIKKRISELLG